MSGASFDKVAGNLLEELELLQEGRMVVELGHRTPGDKFSYYFKIGKAKYGWFGVSEITKLLRELKATWKGVGVISAIISGVDKRGGVQLRVDPLVLRKIFKGKRVS